MDSRTKLGIWALVFLFVLVGFSHFAPKFAWSETFRFSFDSENLKNVVDQSLAGKPGTFAVYIKELPATPGGALKGGERYSRLEDEPFPAASLYKLVLLSAVLKESKNGRISEEETLTSTKTHLRGVYGDMDFGYEDAPENVSFTVAEAMNRVGQISDNFAAIMLTDRLRQLPHKDSEEGLLFQMVRELGMNHTDFSSDPIQTTAQDVGTFFEKLYNGQVVSQAASQELVGMLNLSRINDRIPAGLPPEAKIVHKTGELSHVRHDAGIIFPTKGNPYILVILSKDLSFEDDGVDAIAQLSKDVYDYLGTKK